MVSLGASIFLILLNLADFGLVSTVVPGDLGVSLHMGKRE